MQNFIVRKLNGEDVIHINGVDYKPTKIETHKAGYPDAVENDIEGFDDDGKLVVVLGERRYILEDGKVTIAKGVAQRFWLTPAEKTE